MKNLFTYTKRNNDDIYLDVISVLLVETDPIQAQVLRHQLWSDGYYVRTASSPEAAERLSRELLFDVVIMGERGFPRLTNFLRGEQLLPSLVLTTSGRQPLWPHLALPKPYSRHQFREALRQILCQQ